MQVEVYIDVVFLVNFLMNSFVLVFTRKILKLESKWYKMIISAAIGSIIYCFAMVFIENNIINTIMLSTVLFVTPILISFKPKTIVEFIKIIFTMFITTFLIGGVGFYLYYIITTNSYIQNILYITTRKFPFVLLLVSVAITYCITKIILSILNGYYMKQQVFIVEIMKNNVKLVLKAILDTGNSLYDPETLKPVIIVDKIAIQEAMGYEKESEYIRIPFKSVGKDGGVICGIHCESLKVYSSTYGDMIFYNQVLGLYEGKLSVNGDYSVLLNTRMF